LNSQNNLSSIPELLKIKEHVNKNISSFKYDLGHKDTFLRKAESREKINFPAIRVNYT
jgi:hypothetical protein